MMQSMSADAITQKEERRKRTFTTMGVTASVRAAMDDALGGILDGVDTDADAEAKLQSVMIAAKQVRHPNKQNTKQTLNIYI